MAELLTRDSVNHDDCIHYMGFKLYRDDMVQPYLGIFTEGCSTSFGVRTVNAVGTLDFRSNHVAIQKGKRPDSLYVHGSKFQEIKAEITRLNNSAKIGTALQDTQKKLNS